MKKLTTMTTTTTAARKATAARVTTAARKATAGVELMTGAALRALAVMTMVMLTTATAWAQSEPWTGDGKAGNPYKITSEEELRALSDLSKSNDYSGKYFVLDGDIDMNEGDDGNEMAPIGTSSSGGFNGHFNGQGYTISNLHISGKVVEYAGLFAMNDGEISGVTLAGCTVTGNEDETTYTGGIVGYNYGTVSGCHITGTSSVTGASSFHGGIVGYNGGGMVSGCTSAATVSATAGNDNQYVGGIVGYNGGGTVSGCGNTGSVDISGTGSSYNSNHCGGIVGFNYDGTVSGCINKGAVSSSVSGYNYAGGIVGRANDNASVKIENCANGGAVTASGGTTNCAGGIVGYRPNDSQFVLKDNFYFGACKTKGAAGYTSSGDAPQNDVTDKNGAVEGYAVTAAEGVTGVTVEPAVSMATVEGGEAITSENYFMEGMKVKLGDYTGATPEGFNGYTATTADGSVDVSCAEGAYSFTMPAEAVTVAPAFMATMTGVSYIDEEGKAATTPEGVNVWVLSGATTGHASLGKEGADTWYVVTNSNAGGVDAAFTSVSFRGGVNLILADGAEMQVGTAADGYNNMIGGAGAGMNIYGQTAGTGTLHVNNLEAGSWLDICGGKVTAEEAICAVRGGLGISGGQVSAGTAIYAEFENKPMVVIIGLRRATDYVYAGSNGFKLADYGVSTVVIKGTLIAINSDGEYCGSVSGNLIPGDYEAFIGKTLRLDVWGMAEGKDGTADYPYLITTEEGLRALSDLSKDNDYGDTYFELGGDIDMNEGIDGNEMAPIGWSSNGGFNGHFNGQGHTISNLHISGKVGGCAGLFAVNNGTISGVTLAGCTVTGNEAGTRYTGGIVGLNNNGGTVSGCHITGSSSVSTTGASYKLGGIVGDNEGTVSGCTSAATVSATASIYEQNVGGIVGYNGGGTVSDCGNTGGVAISGTGNSDASYYCGGIVGYIYSGTVSGCINTGAVSIGAKGDNYAGGIAGSAYDNASVTIENCANGGAVTASGGTTNSAGGIVGYYYNSLFVLKDNFYFGACKTKGAAGWVDSGNAPQNDITDGNGAVKGYAVTAAEGVTGVTVAPAVSVKTAGGGTINSGQYYGAGMKVKLGDYKGAAAEGFNGYTAATAGGSVGVSFADGAYSFTMPAEAVTVAPAFMATMTGVSFNGGDGEAVTTPAGVNVWVLSGATTGHAHIGKKGAETWYVVTDSKAEGVDAAFTSVSFSGHVRLILADGAEMQVGNDTDGYNNMIGDEGALLTVFGQKAGTGALHVKNLEARGGLGINGGKVTAEEAISAMGSSLDINGGQVYAGTAIYAGDGNEDKWVTIELSRATDYVYVGSEGFKSGDIEACDVEIPRTLIAFNSDGEYCGSVSGGEAGNAAIFIRKTLRLDVWGMAEGKDGTKEKPYKITTEKGLRALSELSKDNYYEGTYFELGGNIDMNDGVDGNEMAPIGRSSSGGFIGNFNGQGHTISNLHISEKVVEYAGLFGWNEGTISGVTLDGCTVKGNEAGTQYTGGIVGYNYGTVSGCHITGTSSVTGASAYLGGIVGYNGGGTVRDCTSAATVRGTAGNDNQNVGGIVGYNYDGTVSGCGNTGSVDISGTGSSYYSYHCGGIVGYNYDGTVSGCINKGAVSSSASGWNYAGGIVGNAINDASVKIENCANGGAVTATGGSRNFAGGIVGYRPNDGEDVLTNNFYFGACKTTAGVVNEDGSFDVPDGNGAVAGYAVTAAEGVTGVTMAPAVSVKTVGDGTITSGQYYGAGMTVTLGDYTGNVPEGKGLYGYTATKAGGSVEVSFADGAYSFAMPAEAVTVAPDFWDCMTEVRYIDWEGNAATTQEGEPVWVLSGETTGLTYIGKDGEWTNYVVTDSNPGGVDAAFTSVSFRGNVKLILADGAEMKVGNADGGGSMAGEGGANLEILGQTAGTGALHVKNLEARGGLNISGGKVTADKAIRAEGGMIIGGGQVTAGLGIYAGDENEPGIVIINLHRPTDYVYAGENGFAGNGTTDISTVIIFYELFSINGDGSDYVSVSGSDNAGNNEAFKGKTLRLAKYADTNETVAWYISDRKHNDVVRLAYDPTTVPEMTIWAKEELRGMYEAGQIRCIMVAEADEANVRSAWTELSDMVYADRLTLFAPGATNTWGTFCADGDYQLPDGCTAYTLSGIGSGTVTVSPMVGDLLPACVPVMVHRTADVPEGGFTASFEAALKLDEAHGWTENEEMGGYEKTIAKDYYVYYSTEHLMNDLAQGVYANAETKEVCRLLGNTGAKGAGTANYINSMTGRADYALYNDRLIRIEGDPGISRHRCIVSVPGDDNGGDDGGKSRQLSIVIADGEPTAIDAAPATGADAAPGATEWYTLDGRKVDGRPTKKGVYISGGRKVVVK